MGIFFYVQCILELLCFVLYNEFLWLLKKQTVVFKPVLQAPLPCTQCMSLLSDTPDAGLAVSVNELMS